MLARSMQIAQMLYSMHMVADRPMLSLLLVIAGERPNRVPQQCRLCARVCGQPAVHVLPQHEPATGTMPGVAPAVTLIGRVITCIQQMDGWHFMFVRCSA